jgi:hypothetical protein
VLWAEVQETIKQKLRDKTLAALAQEDTANLASYLSAKNASGAQA